MNSEIKPSRRECERNSLSAANLLHGVEALKKNGYLIVRDVLPREHLMRLKGILDSEWNAFIQSPPAWRGGGKIIGHLGLIPPKTDDFITPEILCNPIVQSIVNGVLGEVVCITGIGGNVNMANSVDQQFHSDLDCPQTDKLMVNIPLGDVDERNGSLELISGTHMSGATGEQRSLRANTANGDVIIRFLHLQHRGKRNPSRHPRHMLGIWQTAMSAERQKTEPFSLAPQTADLL